MMNSKTSKLTFVIAWLLFSILALAVNDNKKTITVKELIDGKYEYNGKLVRVEGYASMGFESCVLWPSDPEKTRTPLKYWIWYNEEGKGCGAGEYAKKSKFGEVIIEGEFDINDKGHLGMYSASIQSAKIEWVDKIIQTD